MTVAPPTVLFLHAKLGLLMCRELDVHDAQCATGSLVNFGFKRNDTAVDCKMSTDLLIRGQW
jgi:hypothetical protein